MTAVLKGSSVLIGLGSNLGDRVSNVAEAVRVLADVLCVEDYKVSDFYWSRPVGYTSSHHFVNACLQMYCNYLPMELLETLLKVERYFGRPEHSQQGHTDRLIDLDLLFVNDLACNEKNLQLPHPCALARDFVLKPMQDVVDNWQLFGMSDGQVSEALLSSERSIFMQQANFVL